MARTSQEISQQIRANLKILIPDLSLDPNTPERKIVDTVADVISEASIDQFVLDYQYDVDTKVGSDLDRFVALFGFARQGGRRATGTVTFSRLTPSDRDIVLNAGTQVIKPATSVSGLITFFTTATVVIPLGGTTADAPIEAAEIGPLGNVPANTITDFATAGITDVSEVMNSVATTGGVAEETDAALRVRFKNTIFRNISGTRDQFLALAIASRFANKANIIGPISRFIEYVQIESDLLVLSEIPYSKYTYDFDYYVTDGFFAGESFYAPGGVDYSFEDTVPAGLNINPTGTLSVGDVVLFEHTYCSVNSRNDPDNNIANYVDIYVSGAQAAEAEEALRYPDGTTAFVDSDVAVYDFEKFIRVKTGVRPSLGNRFQELIWQPVISLPSVITIDGIDYYEGTHYWHVKDITNHKGSRRSRDGIEWSTTVNSYVPPTTPYVVGYVFDKLPLTLNELMDKHKQITTDVLVHSATERFFIINLVIMYTPGFSRVSVDEAISTSLTAFLEQQQFGAVIQISDLLDVVHDVPGVDNVRLALPGDGVAYGVQEVAGDGETSIGLPYVEDFPLQDSDLPILQAVVTAQRSQNTWS